MKRPYEKILCCVDRDEMAAEVLDEALRLADGVPSALRIVHVVAPPQTVLAGPFAYVAPVVEMDDEAAVWLREVNQLVPEATTVLLAGDPAHEVCTWAESNGVDLMVAAARRGFMERVMLGGFASRLAYSAPCSLLLIHPLAERRASADAIAQTAGEPVSPPR